MLRYISDPLLTIIGGILRPVAYTAIAVAILAYIYISYPLHADIPLAQYTVRELVNTVGFLLSMLFGIALSVGVIRAGFADVVDHDRGCLLVALTLVFVFQRSEEAMTLGGYTLRGIEAIVAWLTTELFGQSPVSVV